MPEYKIQRGMTVYTADNQALGTVDNVTDTYFTAKGQQYPLNGGYRVEGRNLYLTGNADYAGTDQNTLKVPVYEEQLNVGKRQAEMGEVQIHKTVSQEQVNVPVELRREEVSVNQRDVNDRPLAEGEAAQAFQEGTIRVPVRGEEAVVNKQAVVTGEVDINKTVRADQQTISDTVRREQVKVDDNSARQAPNTARNTSYQAGKANYADTNNAQANSDYATAGASNYTASNVQEGQDVVGNDGELIGRVKKLNNSDFKVDRKMKPDINVTYTAIQNVDGGQVVLNAPAADFNNYI